MSDINRIEFTGRVGYTRHGEGESNPWVSFSVRSEHDYKAAGGAAVVETTWINCIAWKGQFSGCPIGQIQKGEDVHVSGRLRSRQYIDSEGNARNIFEVVAGKVNIIEDRTTIY